MKTIATIILAFAALISCQSASNQQETNDNNPNAQAFQKAIDSFVKSKQADIGLAIVDLDGNDSFFINPDKKMTIMSVVKFPQGLYIMHLVNKGTLKLDQMIHYDSIELKRDTWTPLGEENPWGTVNKSLIQSLYYSVGKSDNVVCDKLYELAPFKDIVSYCHSIGAKDFDINFMYKNMSPDSVHRNFSSARSMAVILKHFQNDRTDKKTAPMDSLWTIMSNPNTAGDRLKMGLPDEAILAHKTGTFFTDSTFIEALNDVGIVELPNKKKYCIVVFVNNSKEGEQGTKDIISELSRMAYRYFSGR
jgi:beta-lactamase class A